MQFDRDFVGPIALIVVLLGIALGITAHAGAQKQRKCAELMSLARTTHDTLEVRLACDVGSTSHSTPVPVVVPVYTR